MILLLSFKFFITNENRSISLWVQTYRPIDYRPIDLFSFVKFVIKISFLNVYSSLFLVLMRKCLPLQNGNFFLPINPLGIKILKSPINNDRI